MSLREINVNNEMGHEAQKMKSTILAIALQKPENYYKLRESVETKVRDELTKKYLEFSKIY